MRRLIEDYEQYINELRQNAMAGGDSYLTKFSVKNDVYEQIRIQQEKNKTIMAQILQQASVLRKLYQYKSDPIPDHFLLTKTRLKQILPEEDKICQKWLQYIKMNHQIKIKIKVVDIIPVLRRIGNSQNQIVFDRLRFHLHHIDQSQVSQQIYYDPNKNIFQPKHVINGRLICHDRSINLEIVHIIRSKNLNLYENLCQKMPIILIAESSYGMILGKAQIHLDQIIQIDEPISQLKRNIIFKQYNSKGEAGKQITCVNTLISKIQISVYSQAVTPLLDELKQNANIETKKNKNSRSPSPNRIISKSDDNRSMSPNSKASLLSGIVKPNSQIIKLTVFQGEEYRHQLNKFNSKTSKEKITYMQIKNIQDKKIDLVKIQQKYYFKCYLTRQTLLKQQNQSYINFKFNDQQFYIYVIQNRLFQIIKYQEYSKITKDQKNKQTASNKLILLPGQILVYAKQSTRIIKNIIKQTIIDGLLSNIFIKTPFRQCQIFTNRPFIVTQIVHKQDGYMIYYYHEDLQPVYKETTKTLFLFSKTNHDNIIQAHMFECMISLRLASKDILCKKLNINQNQSIYHIPMNMITNENYFYEIRSVDDRANVVNGKRFKYTKDNKDLIIQIIGDILQKAKIDIIFYDEKYRSFFVQLELYKQNVPCN